jgi:heme exporter protein C
MWKWIQRQSSPKIFYQTCSNLTPWFFWPFISFLVIGLYWALIVSPADYQQGDGYRIIFIHVPSAILSMMVYAIMAIAGGIGLIWQIKMAEIVAKVSAPIGAAFTIIALVTGAVWGKPMWGAWWVWDARLTSELILLFLYLAYMSLNSAFDNPRTAAKASSILAIVGLVNLPIIHYSVKWWNTLHQGYSVGTGGLKDPDMQIALALMFVASIFLYALLVAIKAKTEVLIREQNSRWVQDEVKMGVSILVKSKASVILSLFSVAIVTLCVIVIANYIFAYQDNSELTFVNYFSFLPYGKYAFYVWLAYGASTLIIIALFFGATINHNNVFISLNNKYSRK